MSGSAPDPRHGEIFAQEPSRALERPKREDCEGCGERLKGRQTRWCSEACNTRWYESQHPRVAVLPEGKREHSIKSLILGLMQDGVPRSKAEIAFILHAREHSVGTRISELTREGHRFESDAPNGHSRRAHRFRLVLG